MAKSRYSNDLRSGAGRRTARAVKKIRDAVRRGNVPYTLHTLAEGQRLDQLAHAYYGDGRLWWVIAAASNVGWCLQCPPGTALQIPTNLRDVMRYV